TSRLAGGLVVGMSPLGPESRQAFLRARAQGHSLTLTDDVLTWLADHAAGSVRQLEGVLVRLAGFLQVGQAVTLEVVRVLFAPEADADRPTVEKIARRVGNFFEVELTQLCSDSRSRNTVLPRQVSMYLARRLTSLSLEQIGAFFGGRDHSTVLHA